MGNRFHLEALHKTLCDFMDTKKHFGGKTILLAGDFRQTLPIIRFASRAQIIEAALTRSYLWSKFVKLSLSENMRIENARRTLLNSDATNEDVTMVTHLERFAEWLLQIGNGTDPTTDELSNIRLPSELCLPEGCDQNALIEWVYPDLAVNGTNLEWLSGRAILAPYNSDVDNINDTISSRFPGDEWVLPSADEVTDTKDATNINPEFLNTLSLSGLPRHDLRLKPNMVVMLLRNMSPIEGLCNGTRLLVQNVINGRLLQAVIATGTHAGNIVFIPRIKLSPDEGIFPFAWSRLQFPVRIAFAMTYVCSSSCLALRFLCHV
jgi:ATP-dependent DNA helicase PIF1